MSLGRFFLFETILFFYRWTEVFYGSTNFSFTDNTSIAPSTTGTVTGTGSPSAPEVNGNDNSHPIPTSQPTTTTAERRLMTLRSTSMDADHADTGLFNWIWISITMS